MIDNLLYYTKETEKISTSEKHILVEIHRPANVDNEHNLREILIALNMLSIHKNIIFSIHPRTKKMIYEFELEHYFKSLECKQPMGYFDFIKSMKCSAVIITDSDGIQQETSILNIPCVSVRDTTNIEYTVKHGTNVLVEADRHKIYAAATFPLYNEPWKSNFPEQLKQLNDGNASERIAEVIKNNV